MRFSLVATRWVLKQIIKSDPSLRPLCSSLIATVLFEQGCRPLYRCTQIADVIVEALYQKFH